jgi:hypothetical protein
MKLIDILKENISEVVPTTSNKYINRGRLNKQAVADYLKSVIDPSELKSVNAFMRDEEGWGESSSYFFDGDDSPGEKLLQAVGKYKGLGQNDDNPLWKELNNNYYNNIFFLNDKLRPKGKDVVEKILSDFGVLKKYQQYVDDLTKAKTEPTEQEVEDWAKQEMSYYLFSSPDEFPSK